MQGISTAASYANIITNLNAAQQAETTATNQLSSGETATDLQGYGAHAETLTAMQSVLAQTTNYVNQAQTTSAKLATQEQGLTQISSSASGAVSSIQNALASGSGTTLMQQVQNAFQDAVNGLNTSYNGQYVFSGGQVNTQATSATSLSDLTSAPSISSLFTNDQHITSTQLDQNTTVQTGFLASNLGSSLYTAFQSIEAYNTGPNGPFTQPLSAAQTTFLQGALSSFQSAATALTNTQAQNGVLQTQVTNAQTSLTDQQTSLNNLIGNITNVNQAQVAQNLQQAQLAMQASSRAFISLQSSSLLSILTASGH
jgi:flagellar hook-associated protein 3 FlgL